MAAILNAIIAIGGTTAHEVPLTLCEVTEFYVNGPTVYSSIVAEDAGGVIGWQAVGLWQGEAHIGSFVSNGTQAKGVGAAMFPVTCRLCRDKGVTEFVGSIRADNVPGLAYYRRMGFVDVAHDPDFALADGRVVGRVHRRFALV